MGATTACSSDDERGQLAKLVLIKLLRKNFYCVVFCSLSWEQRVLCWHFCKHAMTVLLPAICRIIAAASSEDMKNDEQRTQMMEGTCIE